MGARVQDVVGVQVFEHEDYAGCVELGGVVGEEGDLECETLLQKGNEGSR